MPNRNQIVHRCVLLLLFCIGFTAVWAKPKPASHKIKNIFFPASYSDSSSCVIPFNRVGNLIVIQAKVDTTEGNFVLDTGAPGLVLNLTYFRGYSITIADNNEEQASVAGRGNVAQRTTVNELAFGSLHFYRLSTDLTNLGNIENAKGIKVLGLLGLNLFSQCELIIDFEKSVLLLHCIGKKEIATYQHSSLADTLLYHTMAIEISNNRMTTTTEIGGKKLKLVIDCAAESNILDSRLPDKVFENVSITRRVKLTGTGDKKADALYGTLNFLKIGNSRVENLAVVILNLEYTCFSDDICVNGVLGVDFLSQHKIGFNFVKRKMYIWK